MTEQRLLVAHRTELVADRVRLVNRLRDVAAGIVADLAAQLLGIDARIGDLDAKVMVTFRACPEPRPSSRWL